ncbi:MAG: hypothetical protein RLZZ618_4245 [Pseudomonadota bacterium]
MQLAVTTLLASLAVAALKSISTSSSPWDLQAFGGVAQHVSHWRWGVLDGGSGHCFPAGHASTGFAFIGGFFVFRGSPQVSRRWLACALIAGLLFGLGQQVRGAHFMSHTLWSGWGCFSVAWATGHLWGRSGPLRRAAV